MKATINPDKSITVSQNDRTILNLSSKDANVAFAEEAIALCQEAIEKYEEFVLAYHMAMRELKIQNG